MKHFLLSLIMSLAIGLATDSPRAETVLGANGASGLGLVPKAGVLSRGTVTFDYSKAVPGHPQFEGFNYQIGAGLGEGLEINFRLATQSNACNFFKDECPPGTVRDLAGSFKYTLPIASLKPWGVSAAIGALDIGGAATNFRSYYLTATKQTAQWDITLGAAQGQSRYSHLDGIFASVEFRPTPWLKTALQHLNGQSTAHAALTTEILNSGVHAYVGWHRALQASDVLPQQWFSSGLVLPMTTVRDQHKATLRSQARAVRPLRMEDVQTALERQGFREAAIEMRGNRVLQVRVNNVAYPRNVLDAAGVALGVLAGLPDDVVAEIELVVHQRNIPLLRVAAPPSCLRQWYQDGPVCKELTMQSLTHESPPSSSAVTSQSAWAGAFRPEVILSPAASYSIGTEVSSIDLQAAVVSNVVMPLWRGATVDVARIDPVSDWRSREFETGGYFANERYRARTTRVMFHQLWSVPAARTVVRASLGRGFIDWKGAHVETLTTSADGAHRLGVIAGRFKGPVPLDPIFGLPIFEASPEKRHYHLINYRYAWDGPMRMATEVVAGRFWGQDDGAQLTQRFWFGDANVGAYYRRTQLPNVDKPVAFAGLMFTFPLTPRASTGWNWAGVRGPTNFALNIESKVGETDNLLTRGYGEIPRFGESVTQFLNHDRYAGEYFRAHVWRLKNAFKELTHDGP
jgi:hypothetical protein